MCGRYELHTHPAAIALAFGLAYPPDIHARYNICPTQQVPIVRQNAAGERELVQVRWGLVPRWAKDPSIGTKMINARGESVTTKAAYRNAFRRHRCLVPADGFYEWLPVAGGRKQPVLAAMKDGRPFAFAGLYERWLSPQGEALDSCTIITTDANALLRRVHDRMPAIVPPESYARWLDPGDDAPEHLIGPYPADAMTWWPVSTDVNDVRRDHASLRERVPMPDAPAADMTQPASPIEDDADDEPSAPVQPSLF